MISVDSSTIEKTKCDKELACLKGLPVYCSVLGTLGHNMLTLECQDRLECRYNNSYGALHVCKCPVRHEIFKKYGK